MDASEQERSVTLDEIYNQPSACRETLDGAEQRLRIIEPLMPLDQYTDIIFTGCGSSGHIARCAASAWTELLGRPVASVESSELMHFSGQYLGRTANPLIFAISRTGATTEVERAVELMRQTYGASAVAVTGENGGIIASASNAEISFPECDERSIVMTQAFTCMLLGLYALADQCTGGRRKRELEMLPDLLTDAMGTTDAAMTSIAGDGGITRFVFLGSGRLRGLANECALKMIEMALEPALSYPALEFRHGPKAALDENSHVVLFPSEAERSYLSILLSEIGSTGASMTIVSPVGQDHELYGNSRWLRVKSGGLSEIFRPALYVHIGQLLAYRRAEARGINPDHPRHLQRTVRLANEDDRHT